MVCKILQIEIDNQRSLYYIPYCRTISLVVDARYGTTTPTWKDLEKLLGIGQFGSQGSKTWRSTAHGCEAASSVTQCIVKWFFMVFTGD